MSRFADLRATRTLDLGPCECPGKPHPSDQVVIRSDLGYGVHVAVERAGASPFGIPHDWGASKLKLAELGIVSWNLLDAEGKAVEVASDTIAQLEPETFDLVVDELNKVLEAGRALPNEPGAPSAGSSSENGSQTPEMMPSASPTTS